jgi:hypothetical protein
MFAAIPLICYAINKFKNNNTVETESDIHENEEIKKELNCNGREVENEVNSDNVELQYEINSDTNNTLENGMTLCDYIDGKILEIDELVSQCLVKH